METIRNEKNYINSMMRLTKNKIIVNRTGVGTSKSFNQVFEFNLDSPVQPLPILMGKHTGLKTALTELIWIMTGRNDLKFLKDNGVHYWDDWVKKDGTFGPIYGTQMRNFGLTGVDQLRIVVDKLKNNFFDRRIIINLWDPTTMDEQALPPCHVFYHFTTSLDNSDEKIMNLHVTQRSGDSFLGIPYDLLMFMYMMKIVAFAASTETDKIKVGTLFLTVNDYHLYENHIDIVKKYNQHYIDENNKNQYCYPDTIEFKQEFIDKVGDDKDIDNILKTIIEMKFNVFNFYSSFMGSNEKFVWKQQPNLPKFKADVAV